MHRHHRLLDVLLPRVRWRTAQPPQPLLARQPPCGIFARGELATLDAADTMWHGGGGDLGSSTGAQATAATLTKKSGENRGRSRAVLAALPPPPGHQGHAGIFVPDAWASLSTTGIAWRGVGGDLADDVAGELGGGGGGGGSEGGDARLDGRARPCSFGQVTTLRPVLLAVQIALQ